MEILESRQLLAFEGEDFHAHLDSLLAEVLALEMCDGLPERLSGYQLEIDCPFTAVDAAAAAIKTPLVVLKYGLSMGMALSGLVGFAASIPVAVMTDMITGSKAFDGRVVQDAPIADAVFFMSWHRPQ